MANPAIVACTADTWVKVADNKTSGYVWIKSRKPNLYLQTHRVAADPAPSDNSDAILMEMPGMPISNSSGIDVYIKAVGGLGSVRVDV